MKHIRIHIDRCFLCFVGIFILFQVCLGLKDTNASKVCSVANNKISSIIKPEKYLIGKIAPLFANWRASNSISTAKNINNIFKELGIDARLVENTIKFCNGSFEFFVYIPKYNKDFLFRYTPLIGNITKLIQSKGFKLEVKLFSNWKAIPIDKLFV